MQGSAVNREGRRIRRSPVADRPGVDMDEVGARIVADAAALQAHGRTAQLGEAAVGDAQVEF